MRNKLKSVKFWVTVWAMGILTYIVVANRVDFMQLGIVLAAAPMAYIYGNVKQKEILSKGDNK